MTGLEIQNFKNMVGSPAIIPGHISCFLDKSRAMLFAWENASTGHQKVVVHIKSRGIYGEACFLDAGSYDHEQEVLLKGCGYGYVLESVEEIKEE